MKYLNFAATFFRLLGTQNVHIGTDTPHVWKTRLGIFTAAKVAKILHFK
jgi:hypothetical protein